MKYYVSIGHEQPSLYHDEMEASGQYSPVPFGVDTLEEAKTLVAMSKSTVWIVEHSKDESGWSKEEVEASPIVLKTRERHAEQQVKAKAASLAHIARINAQPKVVTKTFAGIAVTFTREDVNEYQAKRMNPEASVHIKAGEENISPTMYITQSGVIQKKKWTEWWMPGRYGTPNPERERMVALAPYLKDIQAVAKSLSDGRYKEEATP